VTGPNMGGKSTVMRQTAHIALLAHAGSFVPAARATIGLVDRIFTRVGASDDLARGESTFMVEMRETAQILAGAGRRSLVLLDELGRGTATYDGLAIAWAVAEHLHDQIGCRAMFATHYHELCALASRLPGAANVHVSVHESKGGIVFLHRLEPGPAERSYGIAVGRLAGLPRRVLARLILKTGKTVTLHVGSGSDTITDLYWGMGRPILDNSGNTIYLYDAQGNLVDEYGW